MINLKSDQDIELYRKTGKIAAEILTRLIPVVKAGVSTYKIAKLAEKWIKEDYDAIASSINNVVCHGVPSEKETSQ